GFVSGTGGKCVRPDNSGKPDGLVKRLLEAVAEPGFYPSSFKLPGAVVGAFPGRLPPLRRGSATLVVGKVKAGGTGERTPLGKTLAYRLEGTAAGKALRFTGSEKVPAPQRENCFLVGIANQWRTNPDRPALLPAERTLAYSLEQNQFARE